MITGNSEYSRSLVIICRSLFVFPRFHWQLDSEHLLPEVRRRRLAASAVVLHLLLWRRVLHGCIGHLSRIHLPFGARLQVPGQVISSINSFFLVNFTLIILQMLLSILGCYCFLEHKEGTVYD